MDKNQGNNNNGNADEDYIDMEVSSSTNFLCYSISSPPQSREFEFQMCSVSLGREETTASPADELFYKGKLLPLHLPPRLLMVQKLTKTEENRAKIETPFESCCNISPSESRRVSSEFNPDEYFYEWSNEMSGFIDIDHSNKKSWTKKLKQIKKSSLGQKLKASRAYIKSLFSKSGCSDDFCANAEAESVSNRYKKVENKPPFSFKNASSITTTTTLAKSIEKEMMVEDIVNSQRRSFSGAIQTYSTMKCSSSSTSSSGSSSSSSSFSFSSNGLLKRSSSANLEIESSIEGAIAHCKQSQSLSQNQSQLLHSRKPVSESSSNVCSLSASRITDQLCV